MGSWYPANASDAPCTAVGDGLTGPRAPDVLDPRDQVADFPRPQPLLGQGIGRPGPDLLHVVHGSRLHEAQPLPRPQRPVHDPDGTHDAAVLVVGGVEDQRAQRRRGVTDRRRDPGDDRVQELPHTLAGLRRDVQYRLGRQPEHVLDLECAAHRVGRRQVDLVEHRDDLEVVLEGLVGVGQRLRLDPLARVHEEDRPLARRQRPRDLVAEVDVTRGVDQVEHMAGVLDPDVLRLDGDAPLPFDVHGVEVLLAHQAGVDGAGHLEDAVRQRRLAVVDVADDGEVADALDHNGSTVVGRGRHGPSIVPASPPVPGRLAWELVPPDAVLRLSGGGRHLLQLSLRSGGLTPCRRTFSKTRGFLHVANIKSQIKRNRQNEKRRLRNKSVRAEMRTRNKSAVAAAEAGAEDSVEMLRQAVKRIDKAASQGVIHKNTAANHKSRLVRRIAAIDAAE